MVTFYVTKMTASCSAIIVVSDGTITLLLSVVVSILLITRPLESVETGLSHLKDGAYYCYSAYVLRISRYSSFLSVMLTNTWIFLRGLKLSGESRS